MYISSASIAATITSLALLSSAANIGRPEIEARNNVAAAKAVLVALKASAFCSSFVPIKDVTSTIVQAGPTSSTEVTETASCTFDIENQKRSVTTTTATTAPSTTSSKCSIKGVQPKLAIFGCQVIKEACTVFVKPKTVKTTVTVPGSTSTSTVTVTPTCPDPPSKTCKVRQLPACDECGSCAIDSTFKPFCATTAECYSECNTDSDCIEVYGANSRCGYDPRFCFFQTGNRICLKEAQDC